MKNCLCVIVFALLCFNLSMARADHKLTYRHSQLVGTIRLIDSLASLGSASPALKILHNRTFPKNDKTTKLIEKLKKANISRNMNDRLYQLASTCEDTKTLQFLIYGLRDHRSRNEKAKLVLLEALEHFSPRYAHLAKRAEKSLKHLLNHLRSPKMARTTDELVSKTIQFYGAKLPIKHLDIVIVPLFGLKKEERSTRAHSYGPLQVIEVTLPAKQFRQYGVVIHEIVHYCQQHSTLLGDCYSQMKKESPLHASLLLGSVFDEALATAIGNGYGEKKAGLKWSKTWYNDPTYDEYAKALYERTKRYLDENKRLDEAYTEFSLTTFRKLFPNIHKRRENVFRATFIATQEVRAKPIFHLLTEKFNGESVGYSSPITYPTTQRRLKKLGPQTRLFVLPAKTLKVLDRFPELNLMEIKKAAQRHKPFIHVEWNEKLQSYNIVIVARELKTIHKLLEAVCQKAEIKEGLHF